RTTRPRTGSPSIWNAPTRSSGTEVSDMGGIWGSGAGFSRLALSLRQGDAVERIAHPLIPAKVGTQVFLLRTLGPRHAHYRQSLVRRFRGDERKTESLDLAEAPGENGLLGVQ